MDLINQLTPRQREVFDLVVEGKTSKEIAEILGIRKRTVDTHRFVILRSTRATNTVQLIRIAAKAGVLS